MRRGDTWIATTESCNIIIVLSACLSANGRLLEVNIIRTFGGRAYKTMFTSSSTNGPHAGLSSESWKKVGSL